MSKFKNPVLVFCLGVISALLLSSCASTKSDEGVKKLDGSFVDKSLVKKDYKKIKNYRLMLYPVGNMEPIALNKDASVKVRLRNMNRKKIRIDEWYMNQANNLIIYYRPFNIKVKKFIPKYWKKSIPKVEDTPRRFELVLMPNNSVLISRKLDFLQDMKLEKGKKKRLMMVVELNLKSVKVRSKIFSVVIEKK